MNKKIFNALAECINGIVDINNNCKFVEVRQTKNSYIINLKIYEFEYDILFVYDSNNIYVYSYELQHTILKCDISTNIYHINNFLYALLQFAQLQHTILKCDTTELI